MIRNNDSTILEGRTIALVSQYFPPEGGAAANRMNFFRHFLHENGATVMVLTAMPNYPEGVIHKPYRGKTWAKESHPWGAVLRSWCYVSKKRSAVRRIVNYLTYMVASIRWVRCLKSCDVVIFSSGPMFAGLVAFLAKKLYGVKVILDARDVWPDRIWESGAIGLPKILEKALHGYEHFMYRNSMAITCATQGVCDALSTRINHPVILEVVRNCDQVTNNSSALSFSSSKDTERVSIIEAGTIGWAQDPGNLCDAFKVLSNTSLSPASLHFAGLGPRVEELLVDISGLSEHAHYVGNLSENQLWEFLGNADVGVVTLQPTTHNLMTVSRRVYDYARAGLAKERS